MKHILLFLLFYLFFVNTSKSQGLGATFVHQQLDLKDFSYGNGAGSFLSFEILKYMESGFSGSYSASASRFGKQYPNFLYGVNFFLAGNFLNNSRIKSNIGFSLEYGIIGIKWQDPYANKLGYGIWSNTTIKNIFKSRINFELILHPHILSTSGGVEDAPDFYWEETPRVLEVQVGVSYNLWKKKNL